ncbi:hypothetical protein K458DRAFT_412264 [Lentithecium fluviatile CBS 122367]|uniref:Zn(2)-C6 fungal-type domain-containing protein n=1 Tax=Lentithecium fluviatile CBS 122367 TaxID=1168545 RepID=A0A6G1JLB5_9PLEO|nr:hypothetical protein K458DRAFT_412264 [Lentithecium fluviatile CBS 122367]
MQAPKEKSSTTSCTECQRRKQKCSREWPCNHCQARKVPHLCQFGQKKIQQASPSENCRERQSESRGQKRSLPESTEVSSVSQDGQDEPEDGLKMWGYMPGHVHYNLSRTNGNDSKQKESSCESDKADEVEKVVHAIPPRSITDAFINHFLTVVNYRYSAIYAPTFTDNYVQWWTDRANSKRLSPEFTCLLLRVLSYSVQYLTPSLRKMIEFELACSSQALTDRFSAAAEELSKSFSASNTCLERVQEQFLKGAWLKSESRIVESWHALSSTIREAQELGIDKDTNAEGLTEFDIEIRRRLWALLFIWDWQMSAWLGRPHLIDQKDLSFIFPNLRLDQSTSEPNLLSPFAHMALQAQLARRIATHLGNVKATRDLSADQVSAVLVEIEKFIDELPPVFKIERPDESLDKQHPYYVFQRYQLHVVIYVTMLDFLKPYLAGDPRQPKNSNDADFRKTGIELGLKLLAVARRLFDHEFPINAKFHMVVFCIFDTATILCSAIIHDIDNVLPHRDQVMNAVESALEMLHQLSLTTKIGASSYRFLFKLVQAAPVLSSYAPIQKRQRMVSRSESIPEAATLAPAEVIPTTSAPVIEPEVKQPAVVMNPMSIPDMTITDDLSFDLDQFLAQNPFGPSTQLDIGGMEQIWDWENLNLDGIVPQNPQSNGDGNDYYPPGI